ncbi:hypothetical protein [Methylobacter tundripaludum]|uniref:hypothetical protein n=1 Tax=Methylobacter tundripaludum TaxID=173365 RepID=UPI0004856995|nr:hypothetical protein [Methylobacter tundripaludum]
MFGNIKISFKYDRIFSGKLLSLGGILYLIIFSFIIIVAPDVVWAKGTHPSLQISEGNDSNLKIEKQIKQLQDSMITLQKTVNQQHQTMNSRSSQLKEGLNKADANFSKLENEINSLDNILYKNSNIIYELQIEANKIFSSNDRNTQGSMLILFSLLFEIPAVIFFSSTSFLETQEDVFTLERSPNMIGSWGSGLEPLDTKIRYLSFIALVPLFIGFALQFVGTVIILTLSFKTILLCIFIVLIIICFVIYYLIGIGSQTRNDKIQTIARNTKRLLFIPLGIEIKRCDFCLKVMNSTDTEIWWLDHASDEPYNGMIRIGHKKCLEKSNWFNPNVTPKICTSTLDLFLKDHVNRIKNKWNEKRKESENYPNMTAPEWDLNRVINKAEIIKRGT